MGPRVPNRTYALEEGSTPSRRVRGCAHMSTDVASCVMSVFCSIPEGKMDKYSTAQLHKDFMALSRRSALADTKVLEDAQNTTDAVSLTLATLTALFVKIRDLRAKQV